MAELNDPAATADASVMMLGDNWLACSSSIGDMLNSCTSDEWSGEKIAHAADAAIAAFSHDAFGGAGMASPWTSPARGEWDWSGSASGASASSPLIPAAFLEHSGGSGSGTASVDSAEMPEGDDDEEDDEWAHEVQGAGVMQPEEWSGVSEQLLTPSTAAIEAPPSPTPLPAAASAPTQIHTSAQLLVRAAVRPIARRACVSCHRLKDKCEDVRPCGRCVRRGCPCEDRSPAELEQAKSLRKRKCEERKEATRAQQQTVPASAASAAATAPLPSPVAAFASLSSPAAMDEVSAQLHSRSHLAVLIQEGLRDDLLRLHGQLASLPPAAAMLLQFSTRANQFLLYISDSLTEEHLGLFLTANLTAEQVASPFYQQSPLAAWLHPSTRPVFNSNQTKPASSFRGDFTRKFVGPDTRSEATIALEDAASPAQMRVEYLPRAVQAFTRWQHQTHAPIQRSQSNQDPLAQSLAVHDESHRGKVLADVAQDATKQFVGDHANSTLLGRMFSYLSLGLSTQIAGDAADWSEELHARYCPSYRTKQQQAEDESHKKARTAANGAAAASSDAAACVCGRSIALPVLVTVNASFERVFGYSQAEVSALIEMEGIGYFCRRLAPPSSWLEFQRGHARQWKHIISMASKIVTAIQAKLEAAAIRAGLMPADAASLPPPAAAMPPPPAEQIHTQLVTRCGKILPCVVFKNMILGESDSKVHGYVRFWQM